MKKVVSSRASAHGVSPARESGGKPPHSRGHAVPPLAHGRQMCYGVRRLAAARQRTA
ncbi:MAG: hypothetical protein FWH21_01630 [Kiritimatiellaeota bacterium]|nr:hypothetical protein [Kiritimatiellota bacterium]